MFNFNTIIDRRNTDSLKWQKYQGKEIIPMWVADMDFASPPVVIEALRRRLSHPVFGYNLPERILLDTLIDLLHQQYNWSIEPKWIVWLPGLVTGINVSCRNVGVPDDQVLTTVPAYPPFLTAPRFSQRHLQTIEMQLNAQGWHFNFQAIEQSIAKNTRLFILCNPHNPTGRVFSFDELTRLANICLQHDLIICSDEIHCDLILSPKCRHIPIASLDRTICDRTITLMAPSKTYNIPGLGCAFAIISNPSLRRRFKQAMAGIVPQINLFGFVAAQAAYQHGAKWLQELLIYLRENRNLVVNAVQSMPGLNMVAGEATYLAWIDTRSSGIADPVSFFEQAGVGLSNGLDFKGPGFVRLNFGCPRQVLQTALDRMHKALLTKKTK